MTFFQEIPEHFKYFILSTHKTDPCNQEVFVLFLQYTGITLENIAITFTSGSSKASTKILKVIIHTLIYANDSSKKPDTEGDMQQIPVYSTKSDESYKLIV